MTGGVERKNQAKFGSKDKLRRASPARSAWRTAPLQRVPPLHYEDALRRQLRRPLQSKRLPARQSMQGHPPSAAEQSTPLCSSGPSPRESFDRSATRRQNQRTAAGLRRKSTQQAMSRRRTTSA